VTGGCGLHPSATALEGAVLQGAPCLMGDEPGGYFLLGDRPEKLLQTLGSGC
jgi:hypothetical protein